MVVIVNMFIHSFNLPFYTVSLNKMELYSLQVASMTMYCGLFYITGAHYSYMDNNILKWFFLICLVVPNVLFFVYWVVFMHLEFAKIFVEKSIIVFKIITCNIFKVDKFKDRFMAKLPPTESERRLKELEDSIEDEKGEGGDLDADAMKKKMRRLKNKLKKL